jgi:hypothetical protein
LSTALLRLGWHRVLHLLFRNCRCTYRCHRRRGAIAGVIRRLSSLTILPCTREGGLRRRVIAPRKVYITLRSGMRRNRWCLRSVRLQLAVLCQRSIRGRGWWHCGRWSRGSGRDVGPRELLCISGACGDKRGAELGQIYGICVRRRGRKEISGTPGGWVSHCAVVQAHTPSRAATKGRGWLWSTYTGLD